MSKSKFQLFFIWLLSFLSFAICNAQALLLNDSVGIVAVKNKVEFLEDKTSAMSFQDVLTSKSFSKVLSAIPNFGISSSSFWLKLRIENNSRSNIYLLQISQPGLDQIDLYYYNSENNLILSSAGEYLSFEKREFSYVDYIFTIELPLKKETTIYLKIKARDNLQVPMFIGTKQEIFDTNKSKYMLFGVYLGVMLVMLLYNGSLFITLKDKSYLYYLFHLVAVILTQLSIQGFTFQYLWTDLPFIAGYSSFIFPPLVGIAGLYFMRHFLKVSSFLPGSNIFFSVFTIAYLVAVIIASLGYYSSSFILIEIIASAVSVFMLIVPYKIYKMGYRPAKFFLLAWSFFLIGVSIYVMKDLGVLPYNNLTNYMMPIGSAIEVVLLSLALADRINILKSEKEISQAEAFKLLTENERIIKEQNVNLENKVSERTAELEASNKNLKETQSQLVDAEKMASLGQLTAGISHEINNPINFVVSNIKPLKRDVQEILLILDKYNEIKDGANLNEKLVEINALKKKLDSDYLKDEINLLLKGIDEGANRTAEIVKGLKNFARADEGDIKKINIHQGIDATLTLLNNNITSNNIRVIKNYSDLPFIECYPGKINQVLMNLLSNSVDALKAVKIQNHEPVISIETLVNNKNIVIKISDNGVGIPKAIISKIFDPFYTTKEVGEGTGLGLSIVYGIIKSHNGKIDVESEENKSTTFTIALPIQQLNGNK